MMRKEAALVLVAALLGCFASTASAADVLTNWTLDDATGQRATDFGALGAHGRLGASSGADAADPDWITGHNGGSALSFDGSQYVAVSDTPSLEPAQVAIDAWVRRSGSPGNWRYVLSKGSVSCDRAAYGMYSGYSGGLAFYVSSAANYKISPEVPSSVVWDGRWHHVIGSYDGATVRLWIDGSNVGGGTPAALSIAYGVGSKGIYIGTYRGSCDRGFDGDVDDVKIWNGAPPETLGVLPVVQPVVGTPTDGAVAGGSPSTTPKTDGQQTSTSSRSCLRVSLNRNRVPLRKRTVVVATVRRGKARAAGVRVVVRGAGITARGKTNRKGKAGIAVRARKRGRLTVRIAGQKASCPAPTVRAL